MERKVYFLALTITVAAVILFNVSLYSSMKEDHIQSTTKQSKLSGSGTILLTNDGAIALGHKGAGEVQKELTAD